MTEHTEEPTPLTYPATFGAELHERGSLDHVLDDALRHAVLTGTGWIRVRFRALEDGAGVEAEHVLGDWTLDAPDPAQIVEVVTVMAAGDPDTTNSPDTTQENP